MARWLLLLIPLLAFVGTVFAILRTGNEQVASLLQQSVVNSWVYVLLYIASGLAFAVYLCLIEKGVRDLMKKTGLENNPSK